MGVNIGNKALKDAYIGNKPIKQIYLGNNLLWQKVPYDAEIEYLQGDGASYIDTLYKANTTRTRAEMRFYLNSRKTQYICGSRNTTQADTNNCSLFHSSYDYRLRPYWAAGTDARVSCSLNEIHDISITRGKFIIDNTTYDYTDKTSINQNNSFYLFGIEDSLSNSFLGRIYYFKIYEDDILVRDYIPVRVGQVGYMYDKVSNQLFGNSGTGNFTLGNDI